MAKKYPQENLDKTKTALARGMNMRISHKDSREIGKAIRGMKISDAREYLEAVAREEKAVVYTRHTEGTSHQKGIKGTGRYPVNAATEIAKLLENLENNADAKGLDVDKTVIKNAQANKGRGFYRGSRSGFGRRTSKATNMHIVAEEME